MNIGQLIVSLVILIISFICMICAIHCNIKEGNDCKTRAMFGMYICMGAMLVGSMVMYIVCMFICPAE